MIEIILFSGGLYLQYIALFLYFLLVGRTLVILISKFTSNSYFIPDTILEIKAHIIYPVFGMILVGNILILLNYFFPLSSTTVKIILLILILPNLLNAQLELDIKNKLTLNNFFYFVVIPSVLLVSSSDINFHYDAAYYHLNNQNWLRESNLIFGFVNIFWPFGMSSIYEYISSVLWLKGTLIYLHFLSLLFIHFLYSFLFFNMFSSKNILLKNGSSLLIIFSILDNFGFSGGRNGYVYIQEVGKQDIAVGILLLISAVTALYQFKKKIILPLDLVSLSLISLFIIQIKVSGAYIFYLYAILLIYIIYKKKMKLKRLMFYQLPAMLFGITWIIKNYLMTGCFIFPVSITCINNFDWYVTGSTEKIEEYTSATSFAYLDYFKSSDLNFVDWLNNFFNSENYSVFSDYYTSVYSNFLISLLVVLVVKIVFFNNKKNSSNFNLLVLSYVIFSISYLVLYGPIPRYTIGILCTIILLLGFYTQEPKYKINKSVFYLFFLISIGLLPRLNSYNSFLENKNIALFDPRAESNISVEISQIQWVQPTEADRCWINLNCRFEEGFITVTKENFFYVATKN
jgi:hypothetical protein